MKDFLGNDLQVGDEVVCVGQPSFRGTGGRYLVKCKVTRVMPKSVDVDSPKVGRVLSQNVFKVPPAEGPVDKETHDRLDLLDALETAGVDNWDGYSEAMELLEEVKQWNSWRR